MRLSLSSDAYVALHNKRGSSFLVLFVDLNAIHATDVNCYRAATLLVDPAVIKLTYICPATDSFTVIVKSLRKTHVRSTEGLNISLLTTDNGLGTEWLFPPPIR